MRIVRNKKYLDKRGVWPTLVTVVDQTTHLVAVKYSIEVTVHWIEKTLFQKVFEVWKGNE